VFNDFLKLRFRLNGLTSYDYKQLGTELFGI
jgi:hypothetical protein